MTTKILDNTFISASIGDIKSIDLISTSSRVYNLETSEEVYKETCNGYDEKIVTQIYQSIKVKKINHAEYERLISSLEARFPYLHRGELSSFLLAFLEFSLDNRDYYYVTDDGLMRKKLSDVLAYCASINGNDDYCGTDFKLTGTIGLIKRLYEKNVLSKQDVKSIIQDIEKSTFRISPEVIHILKGCCNEV